MNYLILLGLLLSSSIYASSNEGVMLLSCKAKDGILTGEEHIELVVDGDWGQIVSGYIGTDIDNVIEGRGNSYSYDSYMTSIKFLPTLKNPSEEDYQEVRNEGLELSFKSLDLIVLSVGDEIQGQYSSSIISGVFDTAVNCTRID